MKYLRQFNESFDVSVGKKIKEEVLGIAFLLNDIDLEVYVGCGANAVVITIDPRSVDDSEFQGWESTRKIRQWRHDLGKNETYLEFVDRILEISHMAGYEAYVEKQDVLKDTWFDFHRITIIDIIESQEHKWRTNVLPIRTALIELKNKLI